MFTRLLRQLIRIAADRRGGVSVMLALMLVPLVGVMGLATETASWYLFQRAAQNAADASALAAAANNCHDTSCGKFDYADEAKAVGTKYSFVSGEVAPTVTTCSDGTICYKVVITKYMPVFLTRIVGYNGTNNSGYQVISAISVARPRFSTDFCMVATGTDGISIAGGPNVNFGNCNVYSKGSVSCTSNGNDPQFGIIRTSGSIDAKCKATSGGNVAPNDPYYKLKTIIPSSTYCPSGNTLKPADLSGHSVIDCSATLKVDSSFGSTCSAKPTASGGTVIVIRNGKNFDLNGNCLRAAGVTIIFTGTAGNAPGFFPAGKNNVLDISAPVSGDWKGVAVYQDPLMTQVKTWTYNGNGSNQIDFYLTGLMYAPSINLSMSGSVNFSTTNSAKCLSLYLEGLSINGSVSMSKADCPNYLGLPESSAVRQALVL